MPRIGLVILDIRFEVIKVWLRRCKRSWRIPRTAHSSETLFLYELRKRLTPRKWTAMKMHRYYSILDTLIVIATYMLTRRAFFFLLFFLQMCMVDTKDKIRKRKLGNILWVFLRIVTVYRKRLENMGNVQTQWSPAVNAFITGITSPFQVHRAHVPAEDHLQPHHFLLRHRSAQVGHCTTDQQRGEQWDCELPRITFL